MRIELDFISVLIEWPLLVKGVAWTIGLTSISTLLGLALGIVLAWSRVHGALPLRVLAGTYVELIRNTPFIVQLFFIFFGLPSLGFKLSPEAASVLAMAAYALLGVNVPGGALDATLPAQQALADVVGD